MADKKHYTGSCHCGCVRFEFDSEPITQGCRCNCSICRRKNAVMSNDYFHPKNFQLLSGKDKLTKYQFGDRDVNHYFCKQCGIYPFHDGTATPGHYKVNLGCVDDINTQELDIRQIEGANF